MDKDNSIKVFVVLERYLIDIDESAKVLAVCKTLDSAKKVMNKESEFIKNNFKDFEEYEYSSDCTNVSFSGKGHSYNFKELSD